MSQEIAWKARMKELASDGVCCHDCDYHIYRKRNGEAKHFCFCDMPLARLAFPDTFFCALFKPR